MSLICFVQFQDDIVADTSVEEDKSKEENVKVDKKDKKKAKKDN